MTSELNEVEETLLEVMTKINNYTANRSDLDLSELKDWHKRLDEARYLIKDVLADEADKYDLCD